MGRKRTSEKKQPMQVIYPFSKEEQIEIQAEAYYKALKRMESEKIAKEPTQKLSQWEGGWLVAKAIIWPFHVSKKFSVEKAPDLLLSTIVITILYVIGFVLWMGGIGTIAIAFLHNAELAQRAFTFIIGLCFLLFGSEFILSAKGVDKIEESFKIESYASGMMGTLAMIVALISLCVSANIFKI
ncbi:MAG: hypothetical protein LKJ90_04095 [Faecalibacterium sp.]|jgi:hypothetical protein|nr:hypothetical protein [Faecalibacterium sp.]